MILQYIKCIIKWSKYLQIQPYNFLSFNQNKRIWRLLVQCLQSIANILQKTDWSYSSMVNGKYTFPPLCLIIGPWKKKTKFITSGKCIQALKNQNTPCYINWMGGGICIGLQQNNMFSNLCVSFSLLGFFSKQILAELTSKCEFDILDSCRFLTGLKMINVIRGSKFDFNNSISAPI